jgi:hypothetical protein
MMPKHFSLSAAVFYYHYYRRTALRMADPIFYDPEYWMKLDLDAAPTKQKKKVKRSSKKSPNDPNARSSN